MKIICFASRPETQDYPEFYLKPDSCLLLKNRPYYVPEYTKNIHCRISPIIKINRLGKYIQSKFAERYYSEIAIGIDFFAADCLNEQIQQGKPWEKAMALDNSLAISDFCLFSELISKESLNSGLLINSEIIFQKDYNDFMNSIHENIAYVSQFITLKIGDYLVVDLPQESFSLKTGDQLDAKMNGRQLISMLIR